MAKTQEQNKYCQISEDWYLKGLAFQKKKSMSNNKTLTRRELVAYIVLFLSILYVRRKEGLCISISGRWLDKYQLEIIKR